MTLTGTCESCLKRKPTQIVTDDWRTRLEKFELCDDCMRDD